MLFTIFVFLAISKCFVNAQNCDYEHKGQQYICNRISNTFPDKYYGAYHLKCTNCNFPSFTDKTFVHENALKSLNVSNSNIRTIAPKAFSIFKSVEYFFLDHNKITDISSESFLGLRQVYEIHLEYNLVKNLNVGFLKGLEANQVILSNNQIEEIPPNVFNGLWGIMTLDLSQNKINELHKESFYHLETLEYLDLQDNNLCHIPFGAFQNLNSLRSLNLAKNRLSRPHIGLFSGLTNLLALNVSSNRFVEFDDVVLLSFRHLSALDVSRNFLNYLDYAALRASSPTLKSLLIDDNLWPCAHLKNLIQYFRSVNVDVINQSNRFGVPNIFGIACSESVVRDNVRFDRFLEAVHQEEKSYVNYC